MGPRIWAWMAAHAHGAPVPGFWGFIGLGLLGAALVYRWRAARDGLPHEARLALAEAFPFALAGSAALPLLFAIPRAIAEHTSLFENGLVSYAGYASGFLALVWRARRRGLSPAALLDAVAPGLGVGIGLGRIGCFMAGCDYGRPTLSALGVRFPAGSPAHADQVAQGLIAPFQPLSLPVHPTELYEAALGWALLALGLWGAPSRPGARFARVAAGYAIGRFAIELVRGDANRGALLGLSTAQLCSLAAVAVVALWHASGRTQQEAPAC